MLRKTTQLSEILKSIYVLAENNQYPLAIEKLDTLISHNKKNHYLYNMRGVIHLQHNQLDLSEKDLKKAKK
jgi:predicted Zn-dependent protease